MSDRSAAKKRAAKLRLGVLATPAPSRADQAQIQAQFGPQEPRNPAELLSGTMPPALEASMIAAGETVDMAPERLASMFGARPDVMEVIQQDRPSTAQLREDFPIATTAGDILPAFAMPAARTIPVAAGQGALIGGALTGEPEGAAAGAVAGPLGLLSGKILARLGSPFASPNPLSKRNTKLAKQLGVFDDLDLGQVTGSKQAKSLIGTIESSAVLGNKLQVRDARVASQLNRQILKSVKMRGDTISDEVLNNARIKASDKFQRAARAVGNIKTRGIFDGTLDAIEASARQDLGPDAAGIVQRNLDRVRSELAGNPSGVKLFNARSEVHSLAMRLRNRSNAPAGADDALEEVANAIDELIEVNSSTANRKLLRTARQDWANLMNLMERNVVVDESINPAALRSVLQRKTPSIYRSGGQANNPQYQLARLQEGIKDVFGRSGTAERSGLDIGRLAGETVIGGPLDALVNSDSAVVQGFLRNQFFKPRSLGPLPVNDRELAAFTSRLASSLAAELFVPESE